MADPTPRPADADRVPPRMPRWVKLLAIIVAVLIVGAVAIVVISAGQHGPGQHAVAGVPSSAGLSTVLAASMARHAPRFGIGR